MSVPQAWCEGQAVPAALAASRAFQYGDGVFRTLLRHRNKVIALEAQLARLAEDAARLDLEAPLDAVRADLAALPPRTQDSVLKLMLVRADAGRGYAASSCASTRWLLEYPRPAHALRCWQQGIVAGPAAIALAAQPALAGVKHLNRLEQVLAYRGTDPALDEVICTDSAGQVICGGRSNVFAVIDGELCTPALDQCGIRGVTRDRVLALAESLGLRTRIGPLPWAALLAADEAFVCNSVIGVWPLAQLQARRWVAPGPLSLRLQAALMHPMPESQVGSHAGPQPETRHA